MLKDDSMATEIGDNIRETRKLKGFTLAHLAKQCDCSASLISQIETGTVNPSFGTLKTISDALETPLAMLLSNQQPANGTVYSLMKPAERKTLTVEGGVKFQLLSRGVNLDCEFILNEWPPGTSTGVQLYAHEGGESGLLLEGELEVEINDEVLRMEPGDTITLASSQPHRISNPGKKKAVAVWVNSVPWVFAIR